MNLISAFSFVVERAGRGKVLLFPALLVPAIALLAFGHISASAENFYSQILGEIVPGYKPPNRARRKVALRKPEARPVKKSRFASRRPYSIGRIGNGTARRSASLKNGKARSRKTTSYRIPRSARIPAGGKYRTLCVRACDGYYFPVSFSARRKDFKRDEAICRSSCTRQASLYVIPNTATDMKEMVAYRGGRKYSEMKNAFLYRRQFISSCRCRPEPWTASERERHKRYARANIDPFKQLAMSEKKMRRRKRRSVAGRKSRRRRARLVNISSSRRSLGRYMRTYRSRRSRRRLRYRIEW